MAKRIRDEHKAWVKRVFRDCPEAEKIENVFAQEDRIELIPVKDGVKIIHIKREEVKSK